MTWLLMYNCEIKMPNELSLCRNNSYNWLSAWLGSAFSDRIRNTPDQMIEIWGNPASTWYNSVKDFGTTDLDLYVSNSLALRRIIPHFTRYEQRCFFMFIFQCELNPDKCKSEARKWLESGLLIGKNCQELQLSLSSFDIKYKTGIYVEHLGIEQPILVNLSTHCENDLDVKHTVTYDSSEREGYSRKMTIEILGGGLNIEDYDIIAHTFFSYFVRTQNLESTLMQSDDHNDRFQMILNRFNCYWAEIRRTYILLSEKNILSRFGSDLSPRKLLGKQLVIIGLLEAQMTKVKNKYLDSNREFEKSYERLLLNIQRYNDKKLEDFAINLKNLLLTNHIQKEKAFNNNYEMMLLYKSGITELRNDHDSENNMTIQIMMSILSIALIFWSAGTLAYDKYMQISNPFPTSLVQFSGYLLPAALGFVIMIYMISMRMMTRTSNIYDRRLLRYIQRNDHSSIKKWLKTAGRSESENIRQHTFSKIAKESDRLICFLLLYFQDENAETNNDLFSDFLLEYSQSNTSD